jgi:5-formyltetrahydrofolate cyclo-ligase
MGIKEDLREKYFDIRQNLSDQFLEEKSKIITDKLDKYVQEKQFNNIMIFVSFRNEINTHPLIKKWLKEKDKNIFVPYIDNNLDKMKISKIEDFHQDLSPGVFDILEPVKELQKDDSANYLDLIVVPGLIFSKQGYRIGYGGGYYDMFLNDTEPEVKKIGIVFSRFIVNELPVDDHDIPVDLIITEEDIIKAER